MFPLALKHLGLCAPQREDVLSKQPSQYWETTVYDQTRFKYFWADNQIIRWDALDLETDVFYFFIQSYRKCEGVMLLNKKSVPSESKSRKVFPDTTIYDFSKFNEEFRWVPDHQADRFTKENIERLTHGGRDTSYLLDRDMAQHKDNGDLMKRFGFRFSGILRHPQPMNYYAPWSKISYYESPSSDMTFRGVWGGRGWVERFDSFVLDVKNLPEEARVLLPCGLDIKPYLHSPPATGLLYEHVRYDKRARIVVQPHIAYLYEDGCLVKILVCRHEDGPPDHGWSLVRGFYFSMGTGYFWPVPRAYSPLEG